MKIRKGKVIVVQNQWDTSVDKTIDKAETKFTVENEKNVTILYTNINSLCYKISELEWQLGQTRRHYSFIGNSLGATD